MSPGSARSQAEPPHAVVALPARGTAGPNPSPAVEVLRAIRERQTTVGAVVEEVLETVARHDPNLHAFVDVMAVEALRQAAELDQELASGHLRPLHGLPIAVKDVIAIAGRPCQAGSSFFGARPRSNDAEAVATLRRAGAVIIGRTVTHEFGFGLDVPPTRNAVDRGRVPGGSSAGSAVAVAAGLVDACLGADSGGSIRIPAAYNGVVGLKPSAALIGTAGLVPMSPALDTIGPIARSVEDCRLLLDVLAPRHVPEAEVPDAGLRLGVDPSHIAGADPAVRHALGRLSEALTGVGVEVVEVEFPNLTATEEAHVSRLMADAADWHRPLLAQRDLPYNRAVRAVLASVGTRNDARALRRRAAELCRHLRESTTRLYEDHSLDVLMSWTTRTTAPLAGPMAPSQQLLDVPGLVKAVSGLGFLMLANLTGRPALALPCGSDGSGMPVGVTILGRTGFDDALLAAGSTLEAAVDALDSTPGSRGVNGPSPQLPDHPRT